MFSRIVEEVKYCYDKVFPNGKKTDDDGKVKRPGMVKFLIGFLVLYAIGTYWVNPLLPLLNAIMGIIVFVVVYRLMTHDPQATATMTTTKPTAQTSFETEQVHNVVSLSSQQKPIETATMTTQNSSKKKKRRKKKKKKQSVQQSKPVAQQQTVVSDKQEKEMSPQSHNVQEKRAEADFYPDINYAWDEEEEDEEEPETAEEITYAKEDKSSGNDPIINMILYGAPF